MPYIGSIPPGSKVAARLIASKRNAGSATLSAAADNGHIEAGSPGVAVEPGRSRSLSLETGRGGMVRIHVTFQDPEDRGELELRVDGAVRDAQEVIGETWWAYGVEATAPGYQEPVRTSSTLHGSGDSRRMPREG